MGEKKFRRGEDEVPQELRNTKQNKIKEV